MPKASSAIALIGLSFLFLSLGCGSDGHRSDSTVAPLEVTSAGENSQLEPFAVSAADGERFGYRDASGRVRIEPRFRLADAFSDSGLAAVVDDQGWAYIDVKGQVVIRPFIFDNGPDPFTEGLARFQREGKVGFFDARGQEVIEARFDFAKPFSEGLAAVCMGCIQKPDGEHQLIAGGKWGYVDRRGNVAIPLVFDEAGSFEGGRAEVVEAGEPRSIGKDGRALK